MFAKISKKNDEMDIKSLIENLFRKMEKKGVITLISVFITYLQK